MPKIEITKEQLLSALNITTNYSEIARMLGISSQTVSRRIKEFGLTEYEKKLQDYDREYQVFMDEERLREYILYLQEFINSGLVSGSIERIYRERLSGLLTDYFSKSRKKGSMIFIGIENYLLDKHYERKHGKNAYYGQGK